MLKAGTKIRIDWRMLLRSAVFRFEGRLRPTNLQRSISMVWSPVLCLGRICISVVAACLGVEGIVLTNGEEK